MSSYAVYYVYDEGGREFVDSYSDHSDAYAEKRRLETQIEADEDAEGVQVKVFEEP